MEANEVEEEGPVFTGRVGLLDDIEDDAPRAFPRGVAACKAGALERND